MALLSLCPPFNTRQHGGGPLALRAQAGQQDKEGEGGGEDARQDVDALPTKLAPGDLVKVLQDAPEKMQGRGWQSSTMDVVVGRTGTVKSVFRGGSKILVDFEVELSSALPGPEQGGDVENVRSLLFQRDCLDPVEGRRRPDVIKVAEEEQGRGGDPGPLSNGGASVGWDGEGQYVDVDVVDVTSDVAGDDAAGTSGSGMADGQEGAPASAEGGASRESIAEIERNLQRTAAMLEALLFEVQRGGEEPGVDGEGRRRQARDGAARDSLEEEVAGLRRQLDAYRRVLDSMIDDALIETSSQIGLPVRGRQGGATDGEDESVGEGDEGAGDEGGQLAWQDEEAEMEASLVETQSRVGMPDRVAPDVVVSEEKRGSAPPDPEAAAAAAAEEAAAAAEEEAAAPALEAPEGDDAVSGLLTLCCLLFSVCLLRPRCAVRGRTAREAEEM